MPSIPILHHEKPQTVAAVGHHMVAALGNQFNTSLQFPACSRQFCECMMGRCTSVTHSNCHTSGRHVRKLGQPGSSHRSQTPMTLQTGCSYCMHGHWGIVGWRPSCCNLCNRSTGALCDRCFWLCSEVDSSRRQTKPAPLQICVHMRSCERVATQGPGPCLEILRSSRMQVFQKWRAPK